MKKIKGTIDYFGEHLKMFSNLETYLKNKAKSFQYKQIITPAIEMSDLFLVKQTLGSEIQKGQMFSFLDNSKRKISLKPEGTLSTVRFYLENKIDSIEKESKFFYLDKVYRYEKPQKGRYREFFQFGVEWFGNDVSSNWEIILFAVEIIKGLKISDWELNINYIGSKNTRTTYESELRSFFNKNLKDLSTESSKKIDKNVLRILDSKIDKDKKLIKTAPSIIDFLTTEEKREFKQIKQNLKNLKIKYKENKSLVRGLDYYNGFVFEIKTNLLGTQDALLGGGRYDSLIKNVDGTKNISSIGFALGVERVIMVAKKTLSELYEKKRIIITTIDPEYSIISLELLNKLNTLEFDIEIDLSTRALNKKITSYVKKKYNYLIILGKELEEDLVVIKDLENKKEEKIKIKELYKKYGKKGNEK